MDLEYWMQIIEKDSHQNITGFYFHLMFKRTQSDDRQSDGSLMKRIDLMRYQLESMVCWESVFLVLTSNMKLRVCCKYVPVRIVRRHPLRFP